MERNTKPIAKDWFTYTSDVATIAAAGIVQQQINIQANSDFIWQVGMFFADIDGAAQLDGTRILPLVTLLITDSATNANLMQTAVPICSIFGNGQFPFVLPEPKVFAANSNISLLYTNFSAATTYRLKVAFSGTKLFYQ